jgi:hypothetical protein
MDELIEQLSRVCGLNGAMRSFVDDPERARVAVRKAITRAFDAIAKVDPEIARELEARVVTGSHCMFDASGLARPEGPDNKRGGVARHGASRVVTPFSSTGSTSPYRKGNPMNKQNENQASPVFGLRYLEDREVEGLDVVGCLISRGGGTATGCDDSDQIVLALA